LHVVVLEGVAQVEQDEFHGCRLPVQGVNVTMSVVAMASKAAVRQAPGRHHWVNGDSAAGRVELGGGEGVDGLAEPSAG
jgi:hypothetical protein